MISLAQTQRERYYEPKLPRVILPPQWVCLQLKMSFCIAPALHDRSRSSAGRVWSTREGLIIGAVNRN